jgi:hypothetical protein
MKLIIVFVLTDINTTIIGQNYLNSEISKSRFSCLISILCNTEWQSDEAYFIIQL